MPRKRPFFLTILANPDVAARTEEIVAGAGRLHANPAENGLRAFQDLSVALGELDLNGMVVFRDFVELKNVGNFADIVDRDLEILEVQERARLPVARDACEEARAELWLEVLVHLSFFISHVCRNRVNALRVEVFAEASLERSTLTALVHLIPWLLKQKMSPLHVIVLACDCLIPWSVRS